MKDPLRIFTKEQLKNLNDFNLRRLKKEFFIPFRFGGASTVVLNNHEVDQSTLEAIFEELEANLDEFIFEVDHQGLIDFFENGSLQFLFDDNQYLEGKNILKSNPKLEARAAKKFSNIIADLSQNINASNLNILNIILDFTSEFSPQNREIAYQACYQDLEKSIDELRSNFHSPFANSRSLAYSSEIGMHVSKSKADLFDYLPESFRPLDLKYCDWCYEVIINKSITRQSSLSQYAKRDLIIFLEATDVASRYHDSKDLKDNAKAAKKALEGGKSNYTGITVIGVILGIYSLIKLISFIANFNSSSSSNSSNAAYSQSKHKQEQIAEILKKLNQAKNKQAASNPQENKKIVVDYKTNNTAIEITKNYVGDNWMLIDSDQNQVVYTKDTLILDCTVTTPPTYKESISSFLPEYKGNISDVALVTFSNADLNIKTSHLLDIKYDDYGRFAFYQYQSKASSGGSKLTLSTKRIPYGNYNVKGIIHRKNTETGSTIEEVQFEIKYDLEKKVFKIEFGEMQFIELTKSEVAKPYAIESTTTYAKKMATIINNLGQLHNKYLKEKNFYTIQNVAEYKIVAGSKVKNNVSNYDSKKGHLRLNYVSNKDNVAYCELNTKLTAFKFLFDQKTGVTMGMIRATTSTDRNEVERIVVIRQ